MQIPISDGIFLDCDIFRPDAPGSKFPGILCASPYFKEQSEPIKIVAYAAARAPLGGAEAGDLYFYARRGYACLLVNVRGAGLSGGQWEMIGPREVQDVCEAIEWVAKQPWCDGNVGMFGLSYFAMIQLAVAAQNPPHLKCIFAPWGTTDQYRDMFYPGGALASGWVIQWGSSLFYGNIRPRNEALEELGKEKFNEAASNALKDADIASVKELKDALSKPEEGLNPWSVNIVLNPLDGQFWEKRRVKYDNIKIPCYIGADWRPTGNHLGAAFRSWENIKSAKRMIVGPPLYLDRPLYQLQYEAIRWFDHWLKGMDTGITKEKPIKLFVMGTNKWKEADEWPLPETKWTPFYLHENSLLSEKDYWPNEGSDSYFDSPWGREYLEYSTPPLVEDTEVVGPIVANIFASSTDSEILLALKLFEKHDTTVQSDKVEDQKSQFALTLGWLRGSHRAVDKNKSKPWLPYHPHDKTEPLEPGKVYEFNVSILPVARLFSAGSRISLVISSDDSEAKRPLGRMIKKQHPSRITILHSDDYPSSLVLPITSGNVLGTFISGGRV